MGDMADAIIDDGIAVECGLDPDHEPGEQRALEREEGKRDLGLEIAAAVAADLVTRAREYAVELAHLRCITIDDVRRELAQRSPADYAPGNWLGAIFRGRQWVRCGYTRSTHKGGHARAVSVWRLENLPCTCATRPRSR